MEDLWELVRAVPNGSRIIKNGSKWIVTHDPSGKPIRDVNFKLASLIDEINQIIKGL